MIFGRTNHYNLKKTHCHLFIGQSKTSQHSLFYPSYHYCLLSKYPFKNEQNYKENSRIQKLPFFMIIIINLLQKFARYEMIQASAHYLSTKTFIIFLFIKLSMDIIRKLFSSQVHQISAKIQHELISQPEVNFYQQQISTAVSQHQGCSSTFSFQNQCKNSSIDRGLNTRFLQTCKLAGQQVSSCPDFGVLVGFFCSQKYFRKHLELCNIVKVGQSQEINSLQALRKKSLDSLVVYLNEDSCLFTLDQIILAGQRLIFVIQSWTQLQNLVQSLQKTLCQIYAEKSLDQCLQYLCLSVFQQDKRYYLEFTSSSFFLEKFRNSLKKIQVQFEEDNQFLRLIQLIKFKDFLQYRQCRPSAIQKILQARDQIQTEFQNQKRRVNVKRFDSLLSTCENQDEDQPDIDSVSKNREIQVDIQAEYFRKRMSEKRETQLELQIKKVIILLLSSTKTNKQAQPNNPCRFCLTTLYLKN